MRKIFLRGGLVALLLLVAGTAMAATWGPNVVVRTVGGAMQRVALTAYGVIYADDTLGAQSTTAMTDGQLLVGQSSAAPAPATLSGDATLAANGTLTLATVPVTKGGTGATTLTGALVGNGTSAVTAGTLSVANGGTGLATMTAVGSIPTGGTAGTGAMVALADAAVGSVLASGGAGVIPGWSASTTCSTSASTTCTIAGQRATCKPICSQTTTVSTKWSAALSSTTITCTFDTSGTNTCNCICP